MADKTVAQSQSHKPKRQKIPACGRCGCGPEAPIHKHHAPGNPRTHAFTTEPHRKEQEAWHADYRMVDYVAKPGAPIGTRASFTVENGHPGLQKS